MSSLFELQKLKIYWYPLSVIIALNMPVGGSVLSSACQVDRKTAHRWINALTDLGYLRRVHFINGFLPTPPAYEAVGVIVPSLVENLPCPGAILPSPGVNLHKDAPTTTTSISLNNINELKAVDPQDGAKCPSAAEIIPTSPDTLKALQTCGIGEPKRSELARLPFMDQEYIERWKTELRRRGKLTPSLLIHCLKTGEPPPEPERLTEPEPPPRLVSGEVETAFFRLLDPFYRRPSFEETGSGRGNS